MSALTIARRHYRTRQRLITAVLTDARRLWRQMDPGDLDGWFRQYGPRLVVILAAAQLAAARDADGYLTATLEAQDIDPESVGQVAPSAFAGIASDGRTLDGLLLSPVLTTKEAIGEGLRPRLAVARGWAHMDMILSTQVADAGRGADGSALVARPMVGGYVRMLQGKSCPRCVILAGRWYRWSSGFARHPRCDCIHIPAPENAAGDWTTNPDEAFRRGMVTGLTKGQRQAIEDGADMSQVVNSRRGIYTAGGREFTREGTTRRGFAGHRLGQFERVEGERYRRSRVARLTPDQIYRDATSRDDAVRLLRRFGYII